MSSKVPWAPSKRIFLFSFKEFDINNETEFSLLARLNDVNPSWIAATALEIPKLGLKYSEAIGKAEDLGKAIWYLEREIQTGCLSSE